MNSLSWLLYLASIIQNVDAVLNLVFIFGSIAGEILCFIWFVDNDDIVKVGPFIKGKFLKTIVPIILVCGVLATFIPDKQTIYMIIASQMGEKIASQPGSQEIFGSLKETVLTELKKIRKDAASD